MSKYDALFFFGACGVGLLWYVGGQLRTANRLLHEILQEIKKGRE